MKSIFTFFKRYTISFLIVYFILFTLNTVSSQAVVREFPYSSEEYLTQLELHFERVQAKDKRDAKRFLKDLEEKWHTDYYSDEMKEIIYETSNLMVKKKMRAMPFFTTYFNTVNTIIEQQFPKDTQENWMKSCNLILENLKNQEFINYLKNSINLIHQEVIYKNRIIEWRADGMWKLEVDTTIRYIFENTNLVCYTKRDSSNIYLTSGVYFPLTNKWIGEGGNIDWQRAGFDNDDMYADLNNYQIEVNKCNFEADSVEFHFYQYFDPPLVGHLHEQVLAGKTGNKAYFPEFVSYTKTLKLKDIFPDIDFSGGFKMAGARMIGVGDKENPVILTFKRNGEKFVTLRSSSFSIEKDKIQSQYASVAIHYKHDSIYHSGLRMSYSNIKRELSLIRDKKGLRAGPFFDTFHQLDIFVEAAYWRLDDDVFEFDMIKGMNKRAAYFQSNNRFSLQHYNQIQMYDEKHPLFLLNQYVNENMSDIVYIIDYAKFLRMPYEQVKLQLLELAHQGFVMYDSVYDRVTVKDRLQFYIDARTEQVDYDVIMFTSKPTKYANAELKLDSFDLKINNLGAIILSDSQNLIIEPKDYIVVGKNRNFKFNGKITAGRFSFKAQGCTFNYNTFKLDMPQIDSLWFWVEGDPLPTGGYEKKEIQTALIDLSGDLLIDHPNNKSGLKPYDEYPIFNSKKESYAYYDHPSIEKGVYTRDKFYFSISPFILNSLNKAKTDNISFDGYLYSGGIFPDIEETLRVMDDYSLGFKKDIPESGYRAYGNKGVFYNSVNLSNRGLRGDGELSYLTSKTFATDYIFYPDSMNVHADEFDLQASTAGVEYPEVSGQEVYQHWMPYDDNMEIHTKENYLRMFRVEDNTRMKGRLDLSPSGLSGDGHLYYDVAVMESDLYKFKNSTYMADTSRFVDDGLILDNFKASADYNDRKIFFTSNGGSSLVEFSDNMFVCYMDEATWYMDKSTTTFAKQDATSLEEISDLSIRDRVDYTYKGSEFISIHPNQDSLRFKSSMATFNTENKEIVAQGVGRIRVADAAIFPDGGTVTILKDAEISPLINSVILANTTTKYHEIEDAEVKIYGRNDYFAKGNYLYVDVNDNKQNIYFENIRVDTTFQTVASGTITKTDEFTLSPQFLFYGQTHLLASRKPLEFEGGYRIKSGCIPKEHWISFKSIVEPKDVMLPVAEQPRVPDDSKVRKYLGIANSPAKTEVYSIFFEDKVNYYDSLIMTASGYVSYDEKSMEYRVSSKDKLLQLKRPDNYISINSRTCATHAEGDINFDIRTGDVHIKSYAIVDEKSGDVDMKVAMALDFHFSEKALAEIVNVFKANLDYTAYNLRSKFYQKAVGGFMGIKPADKYLGKIMLGDQRKVPNALQHTIFINEMDMTWRPALHSYLSKGKINIGNFLKERINGEVTGYVELVKNKTVDEINVYFEINDQWFFFSYSANLMQVLSSLDKFNEIIKEDVTGKGGKNKLDAKSANGKKSKYRYNLLTMKRKKDDFLKRVKPYI